MLIKGSSNHMPVHAPGTAAVAAACLNASIGTVNGPLDRAAPLPAAAGCENALPNTEPLAAPELCPKDSPPNGDAAGVPNAGLAPAAAVDPLPSAGAAAGAAAAAASGVEALLAAGVLKAEAPKEGADAAAPKAGVLEGPPAAKAGVAAAAPNAGVEAGAPNAGADSPNAPKAAAADAPAAEGALLPKLIPTNVDGNSLPAPAPVVTVVPPAAATPLALTPGLAKLNAGWLLLDPNG